MLRRPAAIRAENSDKRKPKKEQYSMYGSGVRGLRWPFLLLLAGAVASLVCKTWADTPPLPPYLGDGDLNGDAIMDEKDLARFIKYWRKFASTGVLTKIADFDKNNRIDSQDAVFIISEYLRLYRVYHRATSSTTAQATGEPGRDNTITALKQAMKDRVSPPTQARKAVSQRDTKTSQ
jgi:hypothetical protein